MALTASKTASCTMAAYRAWANGFCLLATAVLTAIVFQSETTSAFAAAEPTKRITINTLKSLKVTGLPYIFFIAFLRVHALCVSSLLTTVTFRIACRPPNLAIQRGEGCPGIVGLSGDYQSAGLI